MSTSEAAIIYKNSEGDGVAHEAETASYRAGAGASNEINALLDNAKIVCFAGKRLANELPSFGRLFFVTDPEARFDLIIAEREDDIGDFAKFLAQCGNPAAPLIVFSEDFGERADIVLKNPNPGSLVSAIMSLLPVYARLVELPQIPKNLDRSGLLALSLAYTRDRTIQASWQSGRPEAIGYPLLRGVDNPRKVLEGLADAGLMRRQFHERLHMCRNCNSSQIHVREVCVSCRSSNLTEHSLVHHYECGTQASQSDFEHQDGYACPKCNKQLRHYGVDYDKPGAIVSCGSCGKSMAEPDVGFICPDCNHYTSGEESETRDWYHYALLPDGLAALRAGQLPRADLDTGKSGRLSLRDFKLITQSRLRDMRRNARPLAALRLTLGMDELRERVGKHGAPKVCEFALEIATQNLHESDITASVPSGMVICLNDTNADSAIDVAERIKARLRTVVGVTLDIRTDVFEGERITHLLAELDRC
jgi:hypothetical protein